MIKQRLYNSTTLERLYYYSMPVTECGCWIWMKRLNRCGYGQATVNRHSYLAHRVSWEAHVGPIPNGARVLHHCDVRCCINPDHLYLGSQTENMRDMVVRGRSNKPAGEKNGRAKLLPSQVAVIRASRERVTDLAKQFGVTHSTISKVRAGTNWKVTMTRNDDERQNGWAL